jgi:suppressor of fused
MGISYAGSGWLRGEPVEEAEMGQDEEAAGFHVPGLVTDLARGSILALPGMTEYVRERTIAEGSSTGLMAYGGTLHWKQLGSGLRKEGLTLFLGASAARDFGSYLAGRIPFGQPFGVSGGSKSVWFLPGEELSWEEDGDTLRIHLPAAAAREAETAVPPREGTYTLATAPALSFQIEKSTIRDKAGNVVETIG